MLNASPSVVSKLLMFERRVRRRRFSYCRCYNVTDNVMITL